MRIKTLCKLIEQDVKPHTLNDSAVVIDGQNYFYQLYKESGLQFVFGCESDKYAKYLRSHLGMFHKANVQCYFIFKGGYKDYQDIFKREETDHILHGRDFIIGKEYRDIVVPIFAKNINKQVLDEMGFNYTTCEYECKKECIAFAQKHQYPLLSYNAEYCFAGVPYIPYTTLEFDAISNKLKCGLFKLDNFLKKYKITENKLALFATLTDEHQFPATYFDDFLKALKCPLGKFKRNLCILRWLGTTPEDRAVQCIFSYISSDGRTQFEHVQNEIRNFIRRKETPGLPSEYLDNGNKIEILQKDPLWFEKGIASGHIAIPLINITRHHIVRDSDAIGDNDSEEPQLLSIEIIKYMYNLLTNFKNQEITLLTRHKKKIAVTLTDSIEKPNYEAISSPFENGWICVKSGLFEHFFTETMQGFDFKRLEKLPDDSRLLMMALIYFARKKPEDTKCEVYSVLLSYIALGIVFDSTASSDDTNENLEKIAITAKPILDSHTDKKEINKEDKLIAKALMVEYFRDVNMEEAKEIFDPKLLHPLVEFQLCLFYLNCLNKLCGSPFEPTYYSKTYNGTFVYIMVHMMKTECDGNGLIFLKEKLSPAPSILAFLHGLIESYDELMYT